MGNNPVQANRQLQHNQSHLTNAGGVEGNGIRRCQNHVSTKDLLLGTPGRATHINSSAVAGAYPMSDVIYGFRPESAWPGVMFQVFLKGSRIPIWQKQKEIAYWLSFGGTSVKAAFHEVNSTYSLPDIGTKRYVLQCVVPEAIREGPKVPVNLNVQGAGGKTLAQALFLGLFEYKESDGSMITYDYFGNMVYLLEWLLANPPIDIHLLSPINQQEICHNGEVVPIIKEEMPTEMTEYQEQFSQSSLVASQYATNLQELLEFDMKPGQSLESTLPDEYLAQFGLTGLSYFEMPTFEMERKSLEQDISQSSVCPGPVHSLTMATAYQQSSLEYSSQQSVPADNSRSKGYATITFINKPEKYGDPNSWNEVEKREGRRIIKFDCDKKGDVIKLNCYPIMPHQYREGMFTISCVFWNHNPNGEIQHIFSGCCIFTSVDVINLIAQLVDNHERVDIKEKNRIRRNLEGLRPRTVKKEGCTLNFFNQLMNYSQPKTRNIEKDIKVFLWQDLSQALRKIISQYMAKKSTKRNDIERVSAITSSSMHLQSSPVSHAQYLSDFDLSQSLFEPIFANEVEEEQSIQWQQTALDEQAKFGSGLDPQLPTNGIMDGGEESSGTTSPLMEDEQLFQDFDYGEGILSFEEM